MFFGDERWVPVDDPDSNEGMARLAFLDQVDAAGGPLAAPRRRRRSTPPRPRTTRSLPRARPDRPRAPRARSRRPHRVAVPRLARARRARAPGGAEPVTTPTRTAPDVHLSGDRAVRAGRCSPSPATRSARRSPACAPATTSPRHASTARPVLWLVDRRGRRVTDRRTPSACTSASLRASHLGSRRVGHLDPATLLNAPLDELMAEAARLRDAAHGDRVTFSPKVFIPLTMLCRDRCGYCTFAKPPARLDSAVPRRSTRCSRSPAAAPRSAATRRCSPSARRPRTATRAAEWLAAHGYASTVDYLVAAARPVLDETGLLPHANAGALSQAELERLRAVRPSQGMMIETLAARLGEPGGPHSRRARQDARAPPGHARGRRPGRDPVHHRHPRRASARPGTSGSTRCSRSRDAHARHGHVQEVIVQNFLPKPGTAMHAHDAVRPRRVPLDRSPRPASCSGAAMHLQAPPNLTDPTISARWSPPGIDDWGGVSPVTPDHVNPERPWPALDALRAATEPPARCSRRASPSTPSTCATRARGSHPDVRVRGAAARPTPRAWRATTTGPRAATSSPPSLLPRRPDRRRARGTRRRRGARRRARRRGGRRRRDRHAARRRGPEVAGSPRSPTSCGARSSATTSRSSATATSTTRTSARSSAGSARSRRARCR